MAITLNQIAADIENLATSGDLSYSFRIEREQVYFWIHETRSMLISQALSKRQNISDVWVQAIKCLKLIQVDASECCLVPSKCVVLRSEQQLPITIETHLDNSIIRVTTVSGEIITKSNPFEAKYNKYNKYTAEKPQWFIQNGYLYITNTDLLEYVTLYGLFEDPSELADWYDCEGNGCFDIDSSYPVSNKMANDITNYIIKAKVVPFLKFKQDDTNDSNNDNSQLQGNPA